ncbi:asparagine synthase (glutamine-hydrolyzing) [Kitasatospora sp. MAP12-15]|uniref:asparagine synthetase B family protein n=1 Tax=unclassified Kitasatospora TaxID=2633591 RepID=UPI0024770CE0|nr:asparagine synthase-related protein [Kitasatospora sp. MAP12-44]MDH6115460.1 asparagine synthase (glutamine-hydrolyzing) [Kitasatospora sp. MAP12-44]
MSGITGWVDSVRDLRDADAATARLTADLVARGGSGTGMWHSRHAVLAQRVDAAWTGSREPACVRQDGRPAAVAVCDGYLHNARELWSAVGPGETAAPEGPSVAEVVLHAYLRWGAAAAQRLEGSFAFAVWDARGRELVLGRDRFGVKPLSYLPTEHGAVFSSDVAALAAHPLAAPEIDAEGLCALLTQLRSPGRGTLRGMREVPPGHTVHLTPEGETSRRYWVLEARPHELDLAQTIQQVRGLLDDAVAGELHGTEPAVLLSGGLDSSVLTGLAASASGTAPRTFTVAFGDTAAAVPDRPFAQDVVRFWNCRHEEVTVRPEELSDPVTLATVLAAKDYPSPFGDKNITPFLFSRRVAGHVPVALSGEAADTVFGSMGGRIDDDREFTAFPWIERTRTWGLEHGIGTALFDAELLRGVDVGGYCDRLFREASAEVPQLPGDSRQDRLGRQSDYLITTRLLEQAAHHSERLGATAGLQVRFPFLDHRLVSFLYNVPVHMKWFDGRGKSLLRTIAKDLVPESVLTRAKVPYPITYADSYKSALVQRLQTLLDDSTAPVRPLIDVAGVRQVVADPALLDRGGWYGRANVEMVLQVDAWLRRLRVRVSI